MKYKFARITLDATKPNAGGDRWIEEAALAGADIKDTFIVITWSPKYKDSDKWRTLWAPVGVRERLDPAADTGAWVDADEHRFWRLAYEHLKGSRWDTEILAGLLANYDNDI